MTLLRTCLTTAFAALSLVLPPGAQVQTGGSLGGRLTDVSGAVLPGVTVSIACGQTGSVIVAVSDGNGRYLVPGLPAGSCRITFELAGFKKAGRERVEVPASGTVTVDQQLELAALEETVTVKAPAPDPPAVPVKPRPRIKPGSVPPHDTASVCGPSPLPFERPLIRLVGERDEAVRTMYAPGDPILIDAGRVDGIALGQNFVVRRPYHATDSLPSDPTISTAVHTAGVVQVVAVRETSATVAVVYACDEFVRGDDLDVFAPEALGLPRSDGPPDFKRPARVVLADQGHMFGAPGRLMVLDQGTDAGIEVGLRVTLFRRAPEGGSTPRIVGEAVVVAARPEWSRIRIGSVSDVVNAGDLAAPHRSPKSPGR